MSDDWWFRHGEESVVWRGRPRRSAALGGVSVGVVLCGLAVVAAVVVDPRLLAGSGLGVGVVSWAVLRVRRTRYLLTTRALWVKRGVAGRTVRRVALQNVQNTAYSQSVTGSAFGYGTVTIDVAGGRDLRFGRIDDPRSVQTAVVNRVGSTDEDIPGAASQWRSVLRLVREVRATVE